MEEKWVDINEYNGYYQVSNKGNIRSTNRIIAKNNGHSYLFKSIMLKGQKRKDGYVVVILSKDQKQKAKYVHILVAEAFIENPNKKPAVNHMDGDKSNNVYTNLEWATNSENQLHSFHVLNAPRTFSKPTYCATLQLEFKSGAEASNALGIRADRIYDVCRGRTKHFEGLYFRFIK